MKPNDLSHVASLARLSLSEEERAALLPDLRALVALADTLADAKDAVVSPSAQPSAPREDEPLTFTAHDAILAAAPHTEGDYIAVPRVIKEACDD